MLKGGPLTILAHEENTPMDNSLRLVPGKYACLSIEDKSEGMSEDSMGETRMGARMETCLCEKNYTFSIF